MMSARVIPAFLAAVSFCAAQSLNSVTVQPAPQPAQAAQIPADDPADRCIVEGTVVSTKSGEPIRKATISLFGYEQPGAYGPAGRYTAVTDAQGKFRITDVNPGRYNVNVYKAGYGRTMARTGQSALSITLSAKQHLKDLTYKLTPGAVVTGRIVDEDNEAMIGVRVQVMRFAYVQGRRRPMPMGMATTDDQGNYRIHSITPGRYYISATYTDPRARFSEPPPSGRTAATTDEGYAPVYYPGVPDASQAMLIQLQEGEERRGVDFQLRPTHTVRIRGRVVSGATGQPVKDVTVALFPRYGWFGERGFSQVNPNGEFEVRGVTPGSYYLLAIWNSEGKNLHARRVVEVGSSNVDGVSLVLNPGAELNGSIRLESPDSKFNFTEIHVALRPTDFGPYGGGGDGSVRADGTFTLKDVGVGDYRVMVYGMSPEYYIKSVRFGDADGLEKGISIAEGAAGTDLSIILSANAAKLEGSVTDDKGNKPAGATVVIVPDDRTQPDLFKQASIDQYGRFNIRGITPGKYKVFAWDKLEYGAYQDPDFLKAFEDKGKEVTLSEKDSQTLDLKVIENTEGTS